MDLAELQALLIDRGFTVFERTWALGRTLHVTHESLRNTAAPRLRAYADALYVRASNVPALWIYTNRAAGDEDAVDLDTLLWILDQRLINPMWTLAKAQQVIAKLYPAVEAAGYHIGLTGSILTRGESNHDLDLIFYPTTTAKQDVAALEAALTGAGLKKRFDREFILKVWRRKGSLDDKHVESWLDPAERRIDVFRLT